jgi:hypothetical protein
LRKARKLWGKNAGVKMNPKGGFIGDDHKWHDSAWMCCEHGKHYQRCQIDKNCRNDFYVITRDPLKLGRVKYPAPEYLVGCVMMNLFFEVRGTAESFEKAFELAVARWPGR